MGGDHGLVFGGARVVVRNGGETLQGGGVGGEGGGEVGSGGG